MIRMIFIMEGPLPERLAATFIASSAGPDSTPLECRTRWPLFNFKVFAFVESMFNFAQTVFLIPR
jgi:hypothetical protein